MNNPGSFRNWLPVKLILKGNKLFAEWIFLGDVRFTKPFFDETISECRAANSIPEHRIETRITSLGFIVEVAKSLKAFQPALFIFHISRCGSTLSSQLLGLDEENIVIPEFDMIDRLLRINENRMMISAGLRQKLIKSIILIAGQQRFKNQKRSIIKLDSWHFYFFDELKMLFPESKQMIFFSDPDSVYSSVINRPGIQFIPELISPKYYNMEVNFGDNYDPAQYINRVLQFMYVSIEQIKMKYPSVLIHNYNVGMDQILDKIYNFLHLSPGVKIAELARERMLFHSKNPGLLYVNHNKGQNTLVTNDTRKAYFQIKELIEGDN